jgi:hypothetical protein
MASKRLFILFLTTLILNGMAGLCAALDFNPFTNSPSIDDRPAYGCVHKDGALACRWGGECVEKDGMCYSCIDEYKWSDLLGTCYSCPNNTSLECSSENKCKCTSLN